MKTESDAQFKSISFTEKERKSLAILELIRRNGPITRSEISKKTGINIVSISNYMKGYAGSRLVLEESTDVSSGGRRPELAELNTAQNFVIGVSVIPGAISVVVTDIALQLKDKISVPRVGVTPKELPSRIAAITKDLLKKAKIETSAVRAIGAATGPAKDAPFEAALKKASGIETFAEADALCAMFGERSLNPEAGNGTLLYIHGDLGHAIVIKDDVLIGESRYLEPWPEALGMVASACREVERGVGTAIVDLSRGNVKGITADVVVKAAMSKDEVALDIVRSVGVGLGVRIAYLVNLFDPDAVVLGGGLERAPEIILQSIRKTMKRFVLNDRVGRLVTVPGTLGDDAVGLGAAAFALRQVFLNA